MKTYALGLALGLFAGVLPAGAADLQDVGHRIDLYEQGISGIADSVPLAQTNLLALNETLDFKADAITRYVRHDIAFESYRGLLRGPKGTLYAEAGNALDQSVLLATLLGDVGFDVRIQRGDLEPADAKRLALEMFRQHDRASEIDTQKLQQAMDKIARSAGNTGKSLKLGKAFKSPLLLPQQIRDKASRMEGALSGALPDKLRWPDSPDVVKSLMTESRDYFWVEYRMGPQDDWHTAQPAFGSSESPTQLPEVKQTLTSTIPRDLQHRVRIALKIEHLENGDLKVDNLMDRFERPTANLVGTPLTLTLMPSALMGGGRVSQDAILKSRFFIPYFNNHMAPDSKAFSRLGMLVDAGDLKQGSGAAAVFGSLAAETNKGIGALAKAGADKNTGPAGMALGGVYIEITSILPGGESHTDKHYLIDLIKPATRGTEHLALRKTPKDAVLVSRLAATTTVMIGAGAQKAEYALRAVSKRMQRANTTFRIAILKAHAPDTSQSADMEDFADLPNDWPLSSVLSSVLLATPDDQARIRYRPASVVVLHRQNGFIGNRQLQITDVVSNPVRAYQKSAGGTIRWDGASAFAQGIRDTFAEQVFSTDQHVNAGMLDNADAGFSYIDSAANLKAADISDPLARRAMQADLDAGYKLLLPNTRDSKTAAWWRVRPATGQVLGMVGPGYGGDVAEYIDMLNYEISFVSFLNTANQCATMDTQAEKACCFLKAAIMQGIGMGIGTKAKAFGAGLNNKFAASVVELLSNVHYNAATLAVPSGCGGLEK